MYKDIQLKSTETAKNNVQNLIHFVCKIVIEITDC